MSRMRGREWLDSCKIKLGKKAILEHVRIYFLFLEQYKGTGGLFKLEVKWLAWSGRGWLQCEEKLKEI